MKTSELISELQKSLEKNGDLPVAIFDKWRYRPITNIYREHYTDDPEIEKEDYNTLNGGDFIVVNHIN